MNTFGVDYQPGVTVIALREEGDETAQIGLVGDGVRSQIPNAASAAGDWGSRALSHSDICRPSSEDGAWVEEPGARVFWEGLYGRLAAYLGRLAPVRKNGYRLAVALQGANYRTEAHTVAAVARAAGFDEVTVLPATHALLCRGLASGAMEPAKRQTIVAIAVGEASTLVAGFRLEGNNRGLTAIADTSAPWSIDGAGESVWNRRVLELVRRRLNEAPAAGFERALREAAVRYAARLSQASDHQPVEWHEIFEERLYAPLSLSYADCAGWPEFVSFSHQLPDAVRGAMQAIGGESPELLLVGGMGSVWPFAERIAARLGPVWRSGAAAEDIAVGAAWWGELAEHPSGMLLASAPELEAPASAASGLETGQDQSALLPPWERGHADE